jgi:hypothetical protein
MARASNSPLVCRLRAIQRKRFSGNKLGCRSANGRRGNSSLAGGIWSNERIWSNALAVFIFTIDSARYKTQRAAESSDARLPREVFIVSIGSLGLL